MSVVNYYVKSKQVDKNVEQLKETEKKLSEEMHCGYGNALDDMDILNQFLQLTMPRHYRLIASYLTNQAKATLNFIEEDWDENTSYNEAVSQWIKQLKENESKIVIYDDFGRIYSVDELVSTQLHLQDNEPTLEFDPLEFESPKPITVGDNMNKNETMENNKDLQAILSVDTYVLVEPKSNRYVNRFLENTWELSGTTKPKERYSIVAIGQLLTDNYYVPFADVPRGKGIVNFYCPISEIQFKTTTQQRLNENGEPEFNTQGQPIMEEKILYNKDGSPIFRFKDNIVHGINMFNLLASSPKTIPFSLYRLEDGKYHRTSREAVFEQVKNACELGADSAEDAYETYAKWLASGENFGLFTPEDEPLLMIPTEFYRGTTYKIDVMQFVPLEDGGKFYVIAEVDERIE